MSEIASKPQVIDTNKAPPHCSFYPSTCSMSDSNQTDNRHEAYHYMPKPVDFRRIPTNKVRFDEEVDEDDDFVVWVGNTRFEEIPIEDAIGEEVVDKIEREDESGKREVVPTWAKRAIGEEGGDEDAREVELVFPGGFPDRGSLTVLRIEVHKGGGVDLDIEPGWEGVDRSGSDDGGPEPDGAGDIPDAFEEESVGLDADSTDAEAA